MTTKSLLRRMAVMPILAMAVLGFASGTAEAAPGAYACTGGSVPAGTYSSLSITGDCSIDAGAVTVTGSVSVGPTSAARLVAFAPGPAVRLVVKGSLAANGAGAVDLSCYEYPGCVTVAGSVSVSRASYVRLIGLTVGGNVAVSGTTADCEPFASAGVSFSTIRGSVSVTGNTGCVVNVLQNDVTGSMTVTGNTAVNELGLNSLVDGNMIRGNLACSGNSAAGQSIDPVPNVVRGRTTGDCTFPANG